MKFHWRHHPTIRSIRFWAPIIFFVLIFISLYCIPVKADTYTVHLVSHHVSDLDYDFNETNVGAGYGHTLNRYVRLIGGGYYNSLKKVSFYAGINPYLRINTPILTEVGMDAGIITGYAIAITPAAQIYVRFLDSFKIAVVPLVAYGKLQGYVVNLGLTFGE